MSPGEEILSFGRLYSWEVPKYTYCVRVKNKVKNNEFFHNVATRKKPSASSEYVDDSEAGHEGRS